MIAILSPAKRLFEGPALPELPATQPPLLDDATALVGVARPLGAAALSDLMSISDDLGALNAERFSAYTTPFTRDNARQAARLFAGDTYVGLDAASLSPEDMAFAQEHVVILSGLYGVLRPLDLIQPYRLEMGTRLANPRGTDLYAWWGDRLAEQLVGMLEGHADRTIVNLASSEYAKAARLSTTGVRVVTPVFKDRKGDKSRVLGMFAKKARGAAARWFTQHRVEQADALQAARVEGYVFQPDQSDDTTWVFEREQPPPVR